MVKNEIEIDRTKYLWEHGACHCSGHCNVDKLYVDGEAYGEIDNPALCSFILALLGEIKRLRP